MKNLARRGGDIPEYRYREGRRPPITDRGFTLVELVMVLVIIGILAVFVVSRLDFQSTFSERGFHDKLKAGLQFARKSAVAQRRYVCVTVEAAGVVSFTFDPTVPESVVTPSCGSNLALPTPDTSCGATNKICPSTGVTLTAPAPGTSFWFDARGGSSALAPVTFTSTGPLNVTVENETGYVH